MDELVCKYRFAWIGNFSIGPTMFKRYPNAPRTTTKQFYRSRKKDLQDQKSVKMFICVMCFYLGIHFEVDMLKVLQPFVSLGLRTLFHAVDTILHKGRFSKATQMTSRPFLKTSCENCGFLKKCTVNYFMDHICISCGHQRLYRCKI